MSRTSVKNQAGQNRRAGLVAAGLCERCRRPRGDKGTTRMCYACASAVAAYARESGKRPVLGFRGLAAECLRVAMAVNEHPRPTEAAAAPSDDDLAMAVVLAGWRLGPDRERVVRLFRNDTRVVRYCDNLVANGLWRDGCVVVESDGDNLELATVELVLQSLVALGKVRRHPKEE